MDRQKISLPSPYVMASLMLILLAPSELLFGTERFYYFICFIPLAISLFGKMKIRRDKSLAILVFVIWMLLSLVWVNYSDIAIRRAFVQSVTLLFLFFQLQFKYSEEEVDLLKRAMIIQFIFFLIIFFVFGQKDWDGRVWIVNGSNKTDGNSMCSWVITPFCLLYERFIKNRKLKWLYAILMILSVYVVFEAGSRSGIIVLFVCMMICLLYSVNKQIKQHPLLAFIALLMGLGLLYGSYLLLPDSVMDRFSYSNVDTMGGRTVIWAKMLNRLCDNPIRILIGYGEAATHILVGRVAHNLFIEILFNEGVIGLLLIIGYIVTCFRRKWTEDRYISIALLCVAIMSSTLSEFSSRPVMLILFFAGLLFDKRGDNNEAARCCHDVNL